MRKGDIALAGVLTALGVALMIENITATDAAVRIDSRSWLMIPLFAAATLPILWRRRNMLAVTLAGSRSSRRSTPSGSAAAWRG